MHPDAPIALAVIRGAHGVRGEVRLKLLGEGLASLRVHKAFNDGTLRLEAIRDDGKRGAIARFAGIADRQAAEALRGTVLSVARKALPPLGAGEYYHADLIGLAALSTTGRVLGRVVAVANFGAGDVIEIAGVDGRRFMVPMRPEAVPTWDHEGLVISEDFAEP